MLVVELLLVGVKGIVIGGLVVVFMSFLVLLFNLLVILFIIDFYKKFKLELFEKYFFKVGCIVIIVIVVLGFLWIFVMSLIVDVFYEYL